MAFCTFCGTQVPDDIKFCTSCGKPMGITATIPTPAQQVRPQASPVYAQPQTAPPPQQAYTAQPYAADKRGSFGHHLPYFRKHVRFRPQ